MDRFDVLNCAHFQVNLANLSHFYRFSTRRSTHYSLCHAAHNNISADSLAGKKRQYKCFLCSIVNEICLRKWPLMRDHVSIQGRPILTDWMLHTFTHTLYSSCV